MRDTDLGDVLDLNARNVVLLAPMDQSRLLHLSSLADRCDVVEVEESFAGFVITFGPGTTYDSENYRWFAERHDDFYYLDRIVLHEGFRRRGLGSLVYDDVEATAARHGRMTLEANVDNDASIAFHRGRGYVEVGERGEPDHRVTLMEKQLSSS